MKKIAYIAHKISGDIEGNIKKVLAIVRHINLTEPDVTPFAPYIVDLQALDDNIPEERTRGMANNKAYFDAGFIHELRIYSDVSSGIKLEIEWACESNCLIKFYDK